MHPVLHPRLKVCCILNREEAALAVCAGASAVGLVSAMPSGPGVIDEKTITDIVRSVPPPVATFLLTSRQSVDEIVAQHRRVRTSTIQIVDTLTRGTYAELRDHLPGIKIVQVIHVSGPESVDEAVALGGEVDAILLDSGRPNEAVKELGGTGRQHDWSVSRRIREALSIPVFLAGGLRPDNVGDAIRQIGPFGVDVCSGVRTNGRLDARKLEEFVEELQRGRREPPRRPPA